MENSAVSNFISCHTNQWRKPAQVQHPLNDVPAMDHTTEVMAEITAQGLTIDQALEKLRS